MMRFFIEKFGVPYPFKAYTQSCVTNFTFGGMENTTATTLTDLTLHDARAHLDFRSDPLVAHELAHMWFGDFITLKTWSQLWLHEGFATYLDPCFVEFDEGRDEFSYRLLENAERYMREDSSRYRRPIVTNVYEFPTNLFDAHSYPGGSWRLHMLRHQLGDEVWWKVLKHYLTKHAEGVVETVDFQRAIEEITGDPMDRFFDQWIFKAGYPEFKVSQSWDAERGMLKLMVKQQQKGTQETPEVFVVPVDIGVITKAGAMTFEILVEQREQTFYLPVPDKPLMVEFDPGLWVLKTLDFDQPEDMLRYQLKHAKEAMSRIQAAKTLAKKGTPSAIKALKEAVLKDSFWGVQTRAATALGTIPGETALEALVACTKAKHPKTRRGVAQALGNYRDEQAAEALLPLLKEDESYYVESSAAIALGKTKSEKAFTALKKALSKDSFREVIRAGVLAGLAELDDERGIPLAIEWAAYGKPYLARIAALAALGKFGKYREHRKDILEAIVAVFKEPFDALSYRPYIAAIGALVVRGHSDAIAHLNSVANNDPRSRFRQRARRAIKRIHAGKDKGDELRKLREDLEKLQRENITLRDRLAKVEASVTPSKPSKTRTRRKSKTS
jgi:aminopeptidase N